MNHGIVDVFAFQEALLIEAAFGIALLAMIWVGFRRWLQHKERMGRLLGEQAAELAAEHGARIDRVEARLNGVEQIVADSPVQAGGLRSSPAPDSISKPGQVEPGGEAEIG